MMITIIDLVLQPIYFMVQRGGDLFIYPADSKQQEKLLTITLLLKCPVKCSLPMSSISCKGVIRISTDESIQGIKDALAEKNVRDAFRPTHLDGILSSIVILTFATRIPNNVKIACMNYEVRQFFPNP